MNTPNGINQHDYDKIKDEVELNRNLRLIKLLPDEIKKEDAKLLELELEMSEIQNKIALLGFKIKSMSDKLHLLTIRGFGRETEV